MPPTSPKACFDAGERLRPLLGEELRAEVAAVLLVREHAEDCAAGRHAALDLRPHERGDHHRDARLHVERAASPDDAVDELGVERRMRPLLAGRRDDVDMAVEKERRAAVLPRRGVRRGSVAPRPAHAARSRCRRPRAAAARARRRRASFPGGFVVSKRSSSRSSSTGSGTPSVTALLAPRAAGRPRLPCCSGGTPRGRVPPASSRPSRRITSSA